ncbi:MAG: hypothetical protein PHH52_01515 [Patescibacteria group bacterium]|jgi:hypothetical protein|nr:hypothetical protein [Patescibacteria group bacterium]MDD3778037.1 hypothetical protein [Patescibacteria group bacterium]MDD3939436.1 hypothetical protein [Patescibacteria group bacterium]MDD4443885.1 hypothetical protein [Patescibacteria group bacterium]NCU39641.1 hypothetical protein [Candidatus Falkowbacteria bacterium]
MFKALTQFLLFSLVSILLAVFQFSFISALPAWGQNLYPGVIVIVFIIFFIDLLPALYFILAFGFFLDILSFQFFGVYTLTLTAAALVVYFILKNFLTNRSLYSFLAVMFIFIFIYNFLLAIISFIFLSGSFILGDISFWSSLGWQFFWGGLSAIIFFSPLIFWFKKFKPFFLEKKRLV